MTISVERDELLRRRFGSRANLLPYQRRLYGYDAAGTFGLPDAVLRVISEEDVIAAVEVARHTGTPIVARGSGSGLSGGAVPEEGGIVLSFEHMRAVSPPDAVGLRVTVQPGVINRSLEDHLAPLGLFYPPDPASHRVSSIGGNIAENAGGPHALKYGVTGHHVAALHIVDAVGDSGPLVAGELQAGSDLAALVTGSEGTLALLTAAELRLDRLPATVATLLVSFEAMERATAFVSAVIERGIVPATAEFLDRATIKTIEEWGVVSYGPLAGAVLLIDLEGTDEEVDSAGVTLETLGREMGALEVRVARDEIEREALWLGRRASYATVARLAPKVFIQDVTVPREYLTRMLQEVEVIGGRYGLHIATVGHAGDGNLHPDFPYDPADEEMTRRVHAANLEVMQACVAMGGSISGEHGVGTDKLDGMPIMYTPAELGLMAAVKGCLDEANVLNPGKAIPLAPRMIPNAPGAAHSIPEDGTQVQEAVLAARAAGNPLQIDLSHLQSIHVNAANMTIEVGAGVEIGAVEEALEGSALRFPVTPIRERNILHTVLLNEYGPDHLAAGLVRQNLLAVTYVTGAGEIVRMGRAVMKNVAGYDLFRLLIGSRGRFGVPVTFTFRLQPRVPGSWYGREMPLDGPLPLPAGPLPSALFATIDGDRPRVYARLKSGATGWEPAPDAGERLIAVQRELVTMDDVLDLGFPPAQFAAVLAALPTTPLLLLPAAARLFLPIDRGSATRLARLPALDGLPVRALWGRQRESLRGPDGIAARWEARLHTVFDPSGILGGWLLAGQA